LEVGCAHVWGGEVRKNPGGKLVGGDQGLNSSRGTQVEEKRPWGSSQHKLTNAAVVANAVGGKEKKKNGSQRHISKKNRRVGGSPDSRTGFND